MGTVPDTAARIGDSDSQDYLAFRSRLRRLTMSEAVRFRSSERELFGGWYTDHKTRWVLGSTRNTVPFPLAKVEVCVGPDRLGRELGGLAVWSSFPLAGRLTGSGLPCNSASLSSKAGPIRSQKTASAILGFVTTWKMCCSVNRVARYWSRPRPIVSKYTERTLEKSWPDNRAPVSEIRSKNLLIPSIISAASWPRPSR